MVRHPRFVIRPPDPCLAVRNAGWGVRYDVRVFMSKISKPVELIYKAAIWQSTGEPWKDVPITLETANPTYNVTIPELDPWRVSVYSSPPLLPRPTSPPSVYARRSRPHSPPLARDRPREFSPDSNKLAFSPLLPPMRVPTTSVVSKANIAATFQVPDRATIASDGEGHSVTIAKLDLDAVFEWVAIPKKDVRTHLNVRHDSSNRGLCH